MVKRQHRRELVRLIGVGMLGVMLAPLWGQGGISWEDVDALNDAKDFDGAYQLLQQAPDKGAVDYLWRRARHHFNVSDNTTDEDVIKSALYEGFEYAKQALAADSTSGQAHGYYGILIGRVGEIEGTKQKIINSYAVREHTLKAIELDPGYDGWYHVMGRWHYTLSDLSWVERTVASIIYASPPEASFEEAEGYFARATELAPEEIRHFLWLGKTQVELDKEPQAKASLRMAVSLPEKSDSDSIQKDEARALLDDLE